VEEVEAVCCDVFCLLASSNEQQIPHPPGKGGGIRNDMWFSWLPSLGEQRRGLREALEAFDQREELLDGRRGCGSVERQGFDGIEAQAAVAFELGFVEPLVGGGFVREGGIFPAIGQDIGWDAICDRGFYI
jgi:hypothetical protein